MFITFCSFKFALVLRNKTCLFGLQRLSLFAQDFNFALNLGYIFSCLPHVFGGLLYTLLPANQTLEPGNFSR